MKSAFDQNIREVQQYLGFVRENVQQFNESFIRDVRRKLDERREKLQGRIYYWRVMRLFHPLWHPWHPFGHYNAYYRYYVFDTAEQAVDRG